MRDFKAEGDINIGGDVVINDFSSQQHKPLVQCNVEELEDEQIHRINLLKDESERKSRESTAYMKFAIFVALVISIWYFISGNSSVAMYIVGLFGVIVPIIMAGSVSNETTEFEERQLKVLKEIEYLLRERK